MRHVVALSIWLFWGCAGPETERLMRSDGLTRSQAEALQAVEEFSVAEIRETARSYDMTLVEFVRIAEIEGPTLTHAVRRAYCSSRLNSGEDFYSVVETDDWRLGGLPLWSSPEVLASRLGPPDTTFREELPWTDIFGWARFTAGPDTLWFHTVRDSLAYPGKFPLRLGALTAGDVTLEAGAPASEVAAAFPESYRCRNWPLGASLIGTPYDTEVFVDDTTGGGGRIALWLQDDRLVAVGVYEHFGSMAERQPPPRRSE